MQREGAVPDSFVKKKCHAHRIFGLNKALSTSNVLGPVPGVDVMAKRSQGWVKCEDRLPYYKDSSCSLSLATTPRLRTATPRLARTSAGAPGVQGPPEWGSWGFNAARGTAVPDSFVQQQKNVTRIASLDLSTAKHLELLVRATLKSVIGLCSLIASRPFSASPTCNLQPDDRQLRFFFHQCSYSTILRGWTCQPRIPAGLPPCPTAPFSTCSYLLFAHHHPSRPPLTV
jgi:hypothetical protein